MTQTDFLKLKVHDEVRIKAYSESDPNAYGMVAASPNNGRVWIVNINMPYSGTISDFFTADQIDLSQNTIDKEKREKEKRRQQYEELKKEFEV